MAILIGMSGDVRGQSFKIDEEQTSIGRQDTNTITLNNPTVSSYHCCLVKEENRYVLRDLGSTNGTRLNSREVTEAQLKPKDLVQVGSVEFMFDADPGEVVETDATPDALVEVEEGPPSKPQSFTSISPFEKRSKDNKGLWTGLIVFVGLLAVGAVGFLFYKLMLEH